MSMSVVHNEQLLQQSSQPIRPLEESESTKAQEATELECEPYFVNLQALPKDQIEHLRQTGLLPPKHPSTSTTTTTTATANDGDGDDENT